jgi:predicted kinase
VFQKFFLLENTLDTLKKQLLDGEKITVFTGGAPGSGKTTFINQNFPGVPYLDVDEIALKMAGVTNTNLSPEDREKIRRIVTKATTEKKRLFQDYLSSGTSFIHSGTLVNIKNGLNMIEWAENAGFKTAIIFINVPVEIAIERNKKRVEAGERGIDLETAEESIRYKDKYIRESINILKEKVDYYLEVN